MTDDKRRTLRPTDGPEEKPAAFDPSDPVDDEDIPVVQDESEDEEAPQAIDNEEITIEIDDESVEDDADDAPSMPSAKAVLNRLLEKNEIILKLNKGNAEKDKQLKDLNEKWLRSVAEFENYRKRTRKEWELLQQQAKIEVILEILNVLDDFERAFSVVGDRDDEFIQGIRLIFNNLTAVLEKLNVARIEALDSTFDPNYHMAVAQLEKEGAESNHVIDVVQHGYLLGETVVRPAKVVIAK